MAYVARSQARMRPWREAMALPMARRAERELLRRGLPEGALPPYTGWERLELGLEPGRKLELPPPRGQPGVRGP